MKRIRSNRRIAGLLGIEEGQEVFQIRRTRSDRGTVISYIKNYLFPEIDSRITRRDLEKHSMLYVLRHKLGILLRKGKQYIEAVMADYDIASALSGGIASPVLYLETLIYAKGERPVEFVQTFYRSDLYKYTLELSLDEITRA